MHENNRRYGDAQAYSERMARADEAAILIAAGHLDAAEALLREGLEGGAGDRKLMWLMLLELLHLAGRRIDFDECMARHGPAFTSCAPSWGFPRPIGAPGTIALRGVLGREAGEAGEVMKFSHGRKTLVIDMSEVERIEFDFLYEFETLLGNLAAAGKRVILGNVSEINAVLLHALGADRHAMLMRRKYSANDSGTHLQPGRLEEGIARAA